METKKETVPGTLLALTAGVVVTVFAFWYGQNHGLLPEQASEQAPLVDGFFSVMVTIGTVLFFMVEGTIVIALFRFRKRRDDNSDAEPIKGNLPLEAFWTAVPAIIVICLGIYSVQVYKDMGGFEPGHHHGAMAHASSSAIAAPIDAEGVEIAGTNLVKYGFGSAVEGAAPDIVVNVQGMQYAWIFEYPESGAMTAEMHVPVNQSVQLNISALDVIHSFWVPQFRLKQDAIPGQDTQLRFKPTKTGTYPIVCAELCGSYHGGMRAELVVESQESYEAWLEENTYASNDVRQAIAAVDPPMAMLARHAREMGATPDAIAQIPHAQ